MAETAKSLTPRLAAKQEARIPVHAEPSSTVSSFGDWALRCQRLANGADTQRVCEVAQQIRAQGQQNPIAELAIGRLKKSALLRLTLALPVNVTLAKPPIITTDEKTPVPVDLGWLKCLPGGCIADAALKDDVHRDWKSQTSAGRITWTDAAGRDLATGVSFRGLAQALDALIKEP
ncbi:MAG: invasion associated locus B family protein [Pseudolabrys sp.]|nr:invasion associated locus B family protein [Pseudolabrys sp.]